MGRGVGHYEAYFKNRKVERSFKYELITPYDTISLNKKFDIYRKDANELATEINSDIVYIDPPYSSRQYSRFYHVLENITKWEKPELFGSALKPAPENMSEYCSSSAKEVFSDLIGKLNCKYIVVSYNNTYNSKSKSSENKMLLEDIMEILSTRGQTKKYEMPLKAFNAGKTNIDNHKELIFHTSVYLVHLTGLILSTKGSIKGLTSPSPTGSVIGDVLSGIAPNGDAIDFNVFPHSSNA